MKKLAAGSLVVAASPTLLGALANSARADDDRDAHRADDDRGWFFTSISRVGTTADLVVMTGCGGFSEDDVEGGGTFVHFKAGTGPPADIVATGTWKMRERVSFTEVGRWGQAISGILEAKVRLRPVGGPRVPAILKIVCNLGPAGLQTGLPEGFFLTVEGATFSPFAGNTLFTKRTPPD